jgi:hypothetical protein
MRIKGADGHEYNVASQGVGGTGLGLGIAGTALGLLNGGGGLLGGLFGGNNCNRDCGCSDNMLVNRYEMSMQQTIAAKDARIGLLESNIYTDQKIADVYERLNTKINAVKDAQDAINTQQAVYNGVNTATLNCMQGQIAQLYSLTKLIVPNGSICPGWGNVTVAPATTTAG